VIVGETVLFSKAATGRFPEESEILDRL